MTKIILPDDIHTIIANFAGVRFPPPNKEFAHVRRMKILSATITIQAFYRNKRPFDFIRHKRKIRMCRVSLLKIFNSMSD